MFCTNCGAQMPDGSGFCTNCGAKLTAPTVEAAPVAETNLAPEAVSAPEAAPVPEAAPMPEAAPAPEAAFAPMMDEEDSKTIALMPGDNRFEVPVESAMGNAQAPFATQQMNTQIHYGNQPMNNPQMGFENPQMNGQMGMPYANPQMGVPYGQQMNMTPTAPKKPFVMPLVVNIIFGILAVAAVAALVLVMVFGKPKSPELKENETIANNWTENSVDDQTEVLTVDLSDKSFSLVIPENEAYLDAQERLNGYYMEDSNSRYLEYEELWYYTEDEILNIYFEIYARAGVDMGEVDSSLEALFEGKSWYNPTISPYDETITDLSEIMNEYEVANVELIEQFLVDNYGYVLSVENEE